MTRVSSSTTNSELSAIKSSLPSLLSNILCSSLSNFVATCETNRKHDQIKRKQNQKRCAFCLPSCLIESIDVFQHRLKQSQNCRTHIHTRQYVWHCLLLDRNSQTDTTHLEHERTMRHSVNIFESIRSKQTIITRNNLLDNRRPFLQTFEICNALLPNEMETISKMNWITSKWWYQFEVKWMNSKHSTTNRLHQSLRNHTIFKKNELNIKSIVLLIFLHARVASNHDNAMLINKIRYYLQSSFRSKIQTPQQLTCNVKRRSDEQIDSTTQIENQNMFYFI